MQQLVGATPFVIERAATQHERLTAVGLRPIDPAMIEQHKKSELAAAPRPVPFAQAIVHVVEVIASMVIAGALLSVVAVSGGFLLGAWSIVASDPQWFRGIGALCIGGGIASAISCAMILSLLPQSRQIPSRPARWTTSTINSSSWSLPKEVRVIAKTAELANPHSTLILHELVQEKVVLDPILEQRSSDGESSYLAIWKGNKVLMIA